MRTGHRRAPEDSTRRSTIHARPPLGRRQLLRSGLARRPPRSPRRPGLYSKSLLYMMRLVIYVHFVIVLAISVRWAKYFSRRPMVPVPRSLIAAPSQAAGEREQNDIDTISTPSGLQIRRLSRILVFMTQKTTLQRVARADASVLE